MRSGAFSHEAQPPWARATLGLLLLAGVLANAFLRAYDTSSWAPAALLSLVSLAVAFRILREGLERFGAAHERAATSAAWATIFWHAVPLSQVPYFGFVLIPVEVLYATLLARKRQQQLRFSRLMLLAALARGGSLVCGYTARALYRLVA